MANRIPGPLAARERVVKRPADGRGMLAAAGAAAGAASVAKSLGCVRAVFRPAG